MSDPALEPGETVLERFRASTAGTLRGISLAVGIFALITFGLRMTAGDFAPRPWLISVAIFTAIFAAITWFADRRRQWVLTDRRILGPGGNVLRLGTGLRIDRRLTAIRLRDGAGGAMAMRSLPDPRAAAARIVQAAAARKDADD